MTLHYWDGNNFGDRINQIVESSLAAHPTDYVGVGTILDQRFAALESATTIGTGAGHGPLPSAISGWNTDWVRGPLTQLLVGRTKYQGDLGFLASATASQNFRRGLVPHISTVKKFGMAALRSTFDGPVIDPRQDPRIVAIQISECDQLVAEAMHGAIFAEALRVPWARVVLSSREPEFKWQDSFLPIYRQSTQPALQQFLRGEHFGRFLPSNKGVIQKVNELPASKFALAPDARFEQFVQDLAKAANQTMDPGGTRGLSGLDLLGDNIGKYGERR